MEGAGLLVVTRLSPTPSTVGTTIRSGSVKEALRLKLCVEGTGFLGARTVGLLGVRTVGFLGVRTAGFLGVRTAGGDIGCKDGFVNTLGRSVVVVTGQVCFLVLFLMGAFGFNVGGLFNTGVIEGYREGP